LTRPITPALTADIIIELDGTFPPAFVLIERKYPPYGWAIPGGFVDVGETLEDAARREAKEETSLDVKLKVLLGVYSDPSRDFRGHTATAVYIASASGLPEAMDDAKNIDIFTFDNLPELAFDHDQILKDYQHYLKTGEVKKI